MSLAVSLAVSLCHTVTSTQCPQFIASAPHSHLHLPALQVGEWTSTTGLNIMDPDAFHEFGTKNITLKVSTILVSQSLPFQRTFAAGTNKYNEA